MTDLDRAYQVAAELVRFWRKPEYPPDERDIEYEYEVLFGESPDDQEVAGALAIWKEKV